MTLRGRGAVAAVSKQSRYYIALRNGARRQSMRCGSQSKFQGGGAGREATQRPIPTRRFPGIVLLIRWEQSAE